MPHYDPIRKAFREANLSGNELIEWKYQRYMEDYLGSVVSVDENIGRLLEYLDANGLAENTLVIYTSDQGFYLGEHGWYDKRFMYEESLRTPLIMRFPDRIQAGVVNENLVMNLDLAPTILETAGVKVPSEMQGMPLQNVYNQPLAQDWRKSVYYHYYEYPHGWHAVKRHNGVRGSQYKLIHFYNDIDAWEFYDLEKDPDELVNLIDHPEMQSHIKAYKEELKALQKSFGDTAAPAI